MATPYDPKDHIRPLASAPRPENILDQREITIHSYVTTLPFDHQQLSTDLERSWLSPAIQLGGYSRPIADSDDSVTIVLGLQGDLSVRAYDFDARRSLWYSWTGLIVETRAVRYYRSDSDFLSFTTAGGGVRITDDRLDEFNATFLGIPRDTVRRLQFDLWKLRQLCFGRFADRLYMLRFSDPSGIEYKSIDHALFKSRKYIDPEAQRFKEIRDDPEVKVEAFDSAIDVTTDDLEWPIEIRFAVRGPSGALRLRFPKLRFRSRPSAGAEETLAFYRIVDVAVKTILDEDYYARQRLSISELERVAREPELFPDFADKTIFRETLQRPAALAEFFTRLDLAAREDSWIIHLLAIDELLGSTEFAILVARNVTDLAERDHRAATRLLEVSLANPRLRRLGAITCGVLLAALQTIPAAERGYVESVLLAWLVANEDREWEVDVEAGEVRTRSLRFSPADLGLDALAKVLWKLIGVLHDRLMTQTDDAAPDLEKLAWCVKGAAALSPSQEHGIAALRLIASGRVPSNPRESVRVLKEPARTPDELDRAVLEQFGLPLWPHLSAQRGENRALLTNTGIGAALAVTVTEASAARRPGGQPFDLGPGETVALSAEIGTHAKVTFQKLGVTRAVSLSIEQAAPAVPSNVRSLPKAIQEKRRRAQREARARIDPSGTVVGSSPALLEVFEQIREANEIEGLPAVLLLGESGAGKTHIARLIHESSSRQTKPFAEVTAGGTGGDPIAQRGEWLGYGKGHGFQGIEPAGKPGHIIKVQGGTLFVDEFAAFSPGLQDLFLSVLESHSLQKVGGESFTPDVRCIFATNADVDSLAERGSLRRDLLARILLHIRIPSLRERSSDIVLLARHFAGEARFTDRALIALVRHDWPNNIRELSGVVKRAVVRGQSGPRIDLEHLDVPDGLRAQVETLPADECRSELWTLVDGIARSEGFEYGKGLQRRAAEILGVGEAQASKVYDALGLGMAKPA